jgi:hypothetical protein
VPNAQDFDDFFGGTIHNNVRRADKLARSPHLSGPAKAGKGRQPFNAVNNRLGYTTGSSWIVLLDASHSGFKLIGSFGCPPNLSHE